MKTRCIHGATSVALVHKVLFKGGPGPGPLPLAWCWLCHFPPGKQRNTKTNIKIFRFHLFLVESKTLYGKTLNPCNLYRGCSARETQQHGPSLPPFRFAREKCNKLYFLSFVGMSEPSPARDSCQVLAVIKASGWLAGCRCEHLIFMPKQDVYGGTISS